MTDASIVRSGLADDTCCLVRQERSHVFCDGLSARLESVGPTSFLKHPSTTLPAERGTRLHLEADLSDIFAPQPLLLAMTVASRSLALLASASILLFVTPAVEAVANNTIVQWNSALQRTIRKLSIANQISSRYFGLLHLAQYQVLLTSSCSLDADDSLKSISCPSSKSTPSAV